MQLNELEGVMRDVAAARPVFHSEADFQHALAWELQLRYPQAQIQQVAVFSPNQGACRNYGPRVDCQSGDAYPYVILTSTTRGGITVKVLTLKGGQSGHLTRGRNRFGYPVWTFTAL
jgi:hypothetical protein